MAVRLPQPQSRQQRQPDVIPVPRWMREPATVDPPRSAEEFIVRANAFFAEAIETDTRPTITGFALSVGLPGPTSLMRLGQRMPELRYAISRCLTAIASGYEELITDSRSSSGALFMLKNIPDFDPDEPVGSAPVQFFNDRKEVLLHAEITGAAVEEKDKETDETAVDAYMRVIKQAPPPQTQSTKGVTVVVAERSVTNVSSPALLALIRRLEGSDD